MTDRRRYDYEKKPEFRVDYEIAPVKGAPGYIAYDPNERCPHCPNGALGTPTVINGCLDAFVMNRMCTACGRTTYSPVQTRPLDAPKCGAKAPRHPATCDRPAGHGGEMHEAKLGTGVLSWPVKQPAPAPDPKDVEIARLQIRIIGLENDVWAERHKRHDAEFKFQQAQYDLQLAKFRVSIAEHAETMAYAEILRPRIPPPPKPAPPRLGWPWSRR